MAKILIADDEPKMQVLLCQVVAKGGYEFCCASDGEETIAVFHAERPDLILLDVMMPKMNGFQVCQRLRDEGAVVPIIFLTAKGDITDKGVGFSIGADDYVVKPFDYQELLFRIGAHLKRIERITPPATAAGELSVCGDLAFDARRNEVVVRGERVALTPKEFQILYLLASHPGEVFSREQLIKAVWGEEFVGENTSIPVFIRKIREKIEVDPSHPVYLQTAWRSGYRFGG